MVGMTGSVDNILDLIVNSTQVLINNVVDSHLPEGCTDYVHCTARQVITVDALNIIVDKLAAINELNDLDDDETLGKEHHLS